MVSAKVIDEISRRLGELDESIDEIVAGYWIQPDPYSDSDEARVLLLVDFLSEDLDRPSSERLAAIDKSTDLIEQVVEALDGVISGSCLFWAKHQFDAGKLPLNPIGFQPIHPDSTAA